jgi:hypothetical protein
VRLLLVLLLAACTSADAMAPHAVSANVAGSWTATGGTITETGRFTAGTGTSAFVTFTHNGFRDTGSVAICAPGLVLNLHGDTLAVADTLQLTATVTNHCDSADTSLAVTWVSRNTPVATVVSTGTQRGRVTAVSPGFAWIVATSGTYRDSALVCVSGTWLDVAPPTLALPVAGATGGLTASGAIDCGSPGTITWKTRNVAVATVASSGALTATVTGVGAGSVYIIDSILGAKDSSLITLVETDTTTVSAGCPVSGYLRLVNVSTVSQLQAALAASLPGDQIRLAAGTYSTASVYVLNRNGTLANPTVLCGPRTAIIRGAVIRVDYPTVYWTVRGFKIDGNRVAFTGIWDQGAGRNIYDDLEVTNTTQEGIMIKGSSVAPSMGNVIRYNYVHHVGVTVPKFGECIYLGDGNDHLKRVDSTWIHHNVVNNCPAEGIELKTGARSSRVTHNTVTTTAYDPETFPSAVEIRGIGNRVDSNTVNGSGRFLFEVFADHVTGGLNNTFRGNTGSNSGNLKMFNRNTNAGSPLTGNVFYCSNVAVAPTLLNVTCTP